VATSGGVEPAAVRRDARHELRLAALRVDEHLPRHDHPLDERAHLGERRIASSGVKVRSGTPV